jgi:hypothetical protein
MADQVELVGESLKLLKSMEASLRNGSSTMHAGTPYNGRKTGMPGQNNKDPVKATAKAMDKLGDRAEALANRFSKLDRSIKMVTGSFGKMVAGAGGPKGKAGVRGVRGVDATGVESKKTAGGLEDLGSQATQVGGVFGKLVAGSVGLVGAYSHLKHLIEGPVIDVFNDVFKLQRRGISAQENLFDFYLAAGKAGMSLDEYTKLLEENSAVVARAGSFKEFNERLESTSNNLAGLGVFGAAARNLTATMQSSATTLGVPQEQLGGVMTQQIETFKELRKTTMLTASGFDQLVKSLAENETVQNNLLGLAPQERQARMNELLQIRTMGEKMGLTSQQSQKLSDAILAQRQSTAPERFRAMGSIRQGGAIMGMGSDQAEELARLSGKKNLNPEEAKRFTELAGLYKQGLEAMENSDNIQTQNIAEQVKANAPGHLTRILDAAGQAKLTTDSGPVKNKDFGTATGEFGKSVGIFASAVEGIFKNPLWKGLVEVGKIFGSFAAGIIAQKGLAAVLGGGKAKGAAMAATKGGTVTKAALSEGKSAASGIGDILTNMVSNMKNPLQMMRDFATKDIGSLEGIGRGVGKGVGSIVRGVKSVPSAFMSVGKGIASSGSSIVSSASEYAGWFTSILKDGAAAGKEGMTATELIVQEGGALLKGAGKTLLGGFEGVAGIVKGAGSMFKAVFGPELGFIFGAVEELFTGEMTKALDLGDGIFGRILGAVIAGFNGIFTSVTRLFDDAANWLFEGLGINFKVNTTKFFDYITGGIVDGWKMIGSILLKTLANIIESITGIFGIKAPFVKSLRDNADSLDASLAKSSEAREQMWNTEGATLQSVGAKQLEAEKTLADKADAQASRVVTATSKTVNGMDSLVAAAQSTIASAQAGMPAGQTPAQVATPGQTDRASVTPPEVNKTQVEDKKKDDAKTVSTQADNMSAVLAVLQQQLDIAKQQLAVMTGKKEPEPAIQLARSTLPSTADMTNAMYAIGA